MLSITKPKAFEKVLVTLKRDRKVFLVGCGTCTTIQHTGGKAEVLAMKAKLEEAGKQVTGWMVIPTACDPLAEQAVAQNLAEIEAADAILAMPCSFGVQTIALYTKKPVYPALNTMFIGKEQSPGMFAEVCTQCGGCILALTGTICPIVRCAKSLFNGPCGGSVGGKCEVDPNTPCGWQQIIDRLTEQGRLDVLEDVMKLKDWNHGISGGPRQITLDY
jgi:ferredoxin